MEGIFSGDAPPGREQIWADDCLEKSHYPDRSKACRSLQHRFIYRYCYSLVEPLAGDHFFVTAPQVNTLYFEYMLQEFSLHEPEVFKIVFVDKAGYHRTKELKVPENIRLLYLPSSNPELNPVERLWGDMKAKVAFHNFKDEQELEEWIKKTANNYQKEQIASITGYPYIKKAIALTTTDMEYT